MEHDIIPGGERFLKVTRHGIFGLSPGIELALVSSSADARRFHLWEALPHQYLERLLLQNIHLTPDLNRLEGIISQPGGDLVIVTSQPAFEIIPVTQAEIDGWFVSLGFEAIAPAAYYRREDNLGVFDAHEKNVIRAASQDTMLIPFDVIPCYPSGGFLDFVRDSVESGHHLEAVRTTSTGGKK